MRSRGVAASTRGLPRRRGSVFSTDGASASSRPSASLDAPAVRHRHFEIFERQLQLLDLALDFFRTRTKLLPLEFRDPDLKGLDENFVGANRSLQPCRFRLLRDNHRLQHHRVVRKSFG